MESTVVVLHLNIETQAPVCLLKVVGKVILDNSVKVIREPLLLTSNAISVESLSRWGALISHNQLYLVFPGCHLIR